MDVLDNYFGVHAQALELRSKRLELLASTRHMGVVDFKGASHLGLVVEASKLNPDATASAMLFDIYNPWAKLVELNSTHPLTGKRIQALEDIAKAKGLT
ncbi:MAG: hypothetical protein H3C60_14155, partial [Sphingomonadaceae bacterium]|nr:hypothetical protein [Sphingomonadaceae bacterium]